MDQKKTGKPEPDTKGVDGPKLEGSLSAIENQHKTRVTKHPHTVDEDTLPPGAQDIRGLKE
ncbi:hypothetical protein ACFQ49_14115 [Kroppenstedtia eburnea]|uniref:Uncharacterized protein n=1 Tax=Kroppenstedtia eburnea TaxID=714067 RepID=A0A1N7NVF5_9BACL|nr:hypothetical protein [Kroppenstedtia eburnea]QKI81182.1 hypothetical protein GXN75_03750 [Kroppenstedtia eburnea]SIT02314.1 hypothetical protein SAMN05421790_11071 [Kroppenstedtia eburnea]